MDILPNPQDITNKIGTYEAGAAGNEDFHDTDVALSDNRKYLKDTPGY
jgi:hypothetical protein